MAGVGDLRTNNDATRGSVRRSADCDHLRVEDSIGQSRDLDLQLLPDVDVRNVDFGNVRLQPHGREIGDSIERLAGIGTHILAGADLAGDDRSLDRRIDGHHWIDDPLAFQPVDLGLVAPNEHAQTVARRVERALRRLQIGFGRRLIIACLLGLAHRDGLVGKEPRGPLGLPLRDQKVRSRLLDSMQRRDQVGLRLHDFGAVDLEQRIAGFDHIADLGDHPRHAPRKRRRHERAGIFVEGDLADRELVDTKLV